MAKRKPSVYKGSRIPPPKQGQMGKKIREYNKQLRRLGNRKG